MNISTLSSSDRKKKVINSANNHLYFEDMNYNHGFPGPGPPPGGYYGPPGPYGHPPPPMQFDPYGNPIYGGGGYPGGGYPPGPGGPYPQYAPYQPQPTAYPEQQGGGDQQFVRRDPHAPTPPQQQTANGQQPQYPSTNRPPEERILRNPHPHVPISGTREETYDPSLPTYNATPIYQPQFPAPAATQKPQIIAPTLNSIFEIASKKMEQQQQERSSRESYQRPSAGGQSSTPSTIHLQVHVPPTLTTGPQPPPQMQNINHQMQAMQQAMQQGGNNTTTTKEGPTEIITGLITQIQDNFGMVSGEIFFQSSTVVGGIGSLSLGDKVVVEAERVTGMPFKFNGKRVQLLSQDLISSDKNNTNRQSLASATAQEEEEDNELFERRGGERRPSRDFGPLPSMPQSLNLGGGGGRRVETPMMMTTPSQQEPSPQLKSILKRNPPPPPILSASGRASAASKYPQRSTQREEKLYRPESPSPVDSPGAGFTMSSHGTSRGHYNNNGNGQQGNNNVPLFSLDLRTEFPVIKQPPSFNSTSSASNTNNKPLIPIQDLYPELLYVKNVKAQELEDRERRDLPQGYRRLSRSRSRSRSRSPTKRHNEDKKHYRGHRSVSKSPPSRRSNRVRKSRSRSKSPPLRRRMGVRGALGSRSVSPSRPALPSRRGGRRSKSKSPPSRSHKSGRSRSRERERGGGDRGHGSGSRRRSSGSRTPPKKQSHASSSQRRRSSRDDAGADDEDIQILNERGGVEGDEFLGPNPFGSDSEIKAVFTSSTLFPRVKKDVGGGGKGRFSGHESTSDFRNTQPGGANNQAAGPSTMGTTSSGIKFHIDPIGRGGGPVPIQKFVPNPFAPQAPASASSSLSSGKVLVQNPAYNPNATNSRLNPSSAVKANAKAQAVNARLKNKKIRDPSQQEPAFLVKDQNPGGGQRDSRNQGTTSRQEQVEVEAPVNDYGQDMNGGNEEEDPQLRRINELKSSLHAQKMAQIREQERYLLDQKKELELELSAARNNQQQQARSSSSGGGETLKTHEKVKELQKTVSDKLKGLRQNWDLNQQQQAAQNSSATATSSQRAEAEENDETDKIREAIQYQQFLDEERRLKLTGNTKGLSELYHKEERRRRYEEEQRLERLRLDEMRLKKEKNWVDLKKLRDSHGGTAEREAELMNLRQIRKKEEMVDEDKLRAEQERAQELERIRLAEEEEFNRRIRERSTRGEEGPVRRLVMDTQIRQLAKAEIVIPSFPRGTRSPSPEERVPRSRSPPAPRQRSRSPLQRQRSRSRSIERCGGGGRRRHSSPERGGGGRSSGRRSSRERVVLPRSSRRRSRSRSPLRSRSPVSRGEGRRGGGPPPPVEVDREQVIRAQMEAMRRQEEELLMREREIHARMEMMQAHAQQVQVQQQQQQQQMHHQQQQVQYFDEPSPPHHHHHHQGHHHQGHPQYFNEGGPPPPGMHFVEPQFEQGMAMAADVRYVDRVRRY